MNVALRFEFFGASAPDSRKWSGWTAKRIKGCEHGWSHSVVMRVFSGDDTRAVVVFHDWSPDAETICLSVASDGPWLSREIVTAIHTYVFETAKCQLAAIQVSENNQRMNRMAKALGFTCHVLPRLRGRHEAEFFWTITDEQSRNSRFVKD